MKRFSRYSILLILTLTVCVLVSCDALGTAHNHVYSSEWCYNEESHWRESTCGHELIVNLSEHTMDNGVITVEPTYESEGVLAYTCTVCGRQETEPVAKLDPPPVVIPPHTHTFEDEWQYNEDYHWRKANCEHTAVTTARRPHSYQDNACIDCGYLKESEGLELAELPDGTYAVMSPGTCPDKNIFIPLTYNGKPVSSIAEGAFRGHPRITALIIPSSVKSIGAYAFQNCVNLKTVEYRGDSQLASIGSSAFSNCTALESFTVPKTVTSLGQSMFYYCRLLPSITVEEGCTAYKSIDGVLYTADGTMLIEYPAGKEAEAYTIPSSVNSIGTAAFAANDHLESITFEEGSGVTSLPYQAFYYIRNLKEINNLPTNISSIGAMAFDHCMALESITIPQAITEIPTNMLGFCFALTEIVIPSGVTRVGESAFSNCTSLESVTMSEKITVFGKEVFSGCVKLPTVDIPKATVSLGKDIFYGCTELKSVNVHADNLRYKSIDGVLYNKAATKLIYYPVGSELTSLTLPETVTGIEKNAFYLAKNLQIITLPEGLETIGEAAFQKCSRLETINLPTTLTSIGAHAFEDCVKLVSITIPRSITRLCEKVFFNCDSLTSLTIHSDISAIDISALAFSNALESIIFEDTEGWYVSVDPNATEGTVIFSEDLTDPEKAADLLTLSTGYQGYYWKKN